MKNPEDRDVNHDVNPDKFSGTHREGYADVSLAEDKLSAGLTLHPAIGGGQTLDRDLLEKQLSAEGIINGIDWEALTEGIFECNTSHKIVSVPKAALGRRPLPFIPEHIRLEPKFTTIPGFGDLESQRIDFKAHSPYVIVKKNETLGSVIGAQEGVAGIDVFGQEVPAGRDDVVSYAPGENIIIENGIVLAACDGRFETRETTFSVNEVLTVKGDVDYHTGHILFPGDISIEGTVREGFQVSAGGSIFCTEVLEASKVSAKKDIVVGYGILGKKQGLVRAGGEVRAKFIENCTVKARGAVIVSDSILNSRIYTLDRVDLGEKGKVLGGALYAVNGVAALQAGNPAMQVTHIQCGVNFAAQEKLEKVKKRHTELYLKMQKAQDLLEKEEYRKNRAQLEELTERLKEALNQVVAVMNTLLEKVNGNEKADIVIRDTAYPGVTIEICHVSYIVIAPMKKVRFYLDKERGKIVSDTGT